MSTTITRDEWLKACHDVGFRAAEDDQSAVTVTEFAEMVNVGEQVAMRRLRQLVEAGRAVETRKRTLTHNRMVSRIAFRLVTDKPKKKR